MWRDLERTICGGVPDRIMEASGVDGVGGRGRAHDDRIRVRSA